jgi:hypothetical protein
MRFDRENLDIEGKQENKEANRARRKRGLC